jgi:hypothetical protein
LITDWPGRARNTTDEKVPSEIAYLDQGFEWGNKIEPHRTREAWTKLLLDERQKREQLRLTLELLTGNMDSIENDRVNTEPAPHPGKEPVDIIGDFLSGVRAHVQSTLETRYGKLLSLFETEVVITVPAVWSDKAKDLTYKAVSKAGFNTEDTKVSMITEPEAAAIYSLRELADGPFKNICVGFTPPLRLHDQVFTYSKGWRPFCSLRCRRRNSCKSAQRRSSLVFQLRNPHIGRISLHIESTPLNQSSK